MLSNEQIFKTFDSIKDAFDVIHSHSLIALKYTFSTEKQLIKGEKDKLCFFRINMREHLKTFQGLLDCVDRLVNNVLEDKEEEKNE